MARLEYLPQQEKLQCFFLNPETCPLVYLFCPAGRECVCKTNKSMRINTAATNYECVHFLNYIWIEHSSNCWVNYLMKKGNVKKKKT